MEEVVFPVRVLGMLGIKSLIVTNASGGINTDIPPGGIVAIRITSILWAPTRLSEKTMMISDRVS